MASLGKDISKIRQEQELTLEDIHEETRIPVHILRSIELDTVFDDIDENRTYIRSYIRSYAKFLGIEDEFIIWCLNLAENDEYDGQLLNPEKYSQDAESADDSQDPEISKAQSVASGASSGKKPKWSYDQTSTPKPSIKSYNWANIGQSLTSFDGAFFLKVGIGIIIIIVGFLAYNYLIGDDNTGGQVQESQTNQTQNILPVDSLETSYITPDSTTLLDDTTAESNTTTDTTAALTPPDTLNLIIYAAYDKLEPVRVNSDIGDSIDPYWLEEGVAMRFAFTDSIKIRGQYNRMILLLNGQPIPEVTQNYYDRQKRFIILRREFFTESRWFKPVPDSLPLEAPQPDTIISRPIFN